MLWSYENIFCAQKKLLSYSCEHLAKTDTEENKLLNTVFVQSTVEYSLQFFVRKKYSRSFIKLRLNHWCHTDSFNDVLTIKMFQLCCCLYTVRKLWDFISILICVPKMNEGLTGLELHKVE